MKTVKKVSLEETIEVLKNKKLTFKMKEDFSMKEFYSFLRKGFLYGSIDKTLFVNQKTYKYLQKLLKKYSCSKGKDHITGKVFIYFISPFGSVRIIKSLKVKETMFLVDVLKVKDTHFAECHLLGIIK